MGGNRPSIHSQSYGIGLAAILIALNGRGAPLFERKAEAHFLAG